MRKRVLLAVMVAASAAAALGGVQLANAVGTDDGHGPKAAASLVCSAGQPSSNAHIKHVIYLVFDNTHYNKDRPNVASDLQQMPHLLNFLTGNGTLLTNNHTILISHTAGGILTSMTGLYPDRQGQTVSNAYGYFGANGNPSFSSSFKYWTDTVDGADDSLPNMVSDGGQTTTPPWQAFTHAGCNVGGVSAANIELENNNAIVTSTGLTDPAGDMTRVFGEGSLEWNEGKASQLAPSNTPARGLAQADFVGIAIHCAKDAALCNSPNAKPDDSTIVRGSDGGYKALFGAKYVNPAITGGQLCVNDTTGHPITDPFGQCGFPGFDGALAKNTLGMVAQMQEHGVPVTYAYISDAHDNHDLARASGPGEADYKKQLADYDTAFATFFQRLANDGITKDNTLFVVTADEGDHFAGGTGTPQADGSLAYTHANCTTLTACPANQIGEVNVKLQSILPAGSPALSIHADDAPTFYVNGNPTRTDPAVRKLERDLSATTLTNPYANGASVPIAQRFADSVEEKTLHMVNADPKRTPTFTMFGDADFFFTTGTVFCGANVCVDPKFAWNHGDYQDEIGNTWLGIVGPGVQRLGTNDKVWADHSDTRPTMLSILGLNDSYEMDGRVITQVVAKNAGEERRAADNKESDTLTELGDAYKQLNAPYGSFGLDTLKASTRAIASSDELEYDMIETQIANLTFKRDELAGAIRSALNDVSFDGGKLDQSQARAWISRAQSLIDQARALAGP
jgi:hypothetical protein